jgi:insertion element IS1 protein InsB
VGWSVVEVRDGDALQEVVDQAPASPRYFSDGFCVYQALMYAPGKHEVAPGKSETYSVEGGNADLRHYLARLGRKSRCFSRCIEALRRAVFLFVHCYNQRQLWQRAHPKYKRNVIDFLPLLN